jgi:hypothetical protein
MKPIIALVLLFLLGGCRKAGQSGPVAGACDLLEPEQVQAVIGAPIEQRKTSSHGSGGLLISQCFYSANPPVESVSVVLTRTDPTAKGGLRARDFWKNAFSSEGEKKEAGEKKEKRPPREIKGLGDGAYWTAGSLYVLHGDAFLRVSVGGPEPEETKLEHAKALAKVALNHF